MMTAMNDSQKIHDHFTNLMSQGWDVDASRAYASTYTPPPSSGPPQTPPSSAMQTIIYRARETQKDDWTTYVWELGPTNPNAFLNPSPTAMLDWGLVPRNQASLDLQNQLGIALPGNFTLDPWKEADYQAVGITDWEGAAGDKTGDETPDENEGEKNKGGDN
jgi:hypothetical protein